MLKCNICFTIRFNINAIIVLPVSTMLLSILHENMQELMQLPNIIVVYVVRNISLLSIDQEYYMCNYVYQNLELFYNYEPTNKELLFSNH